MISSTYPYARTAPGVRLQGADELPQQILRYLMDLPLPGYSPPDDNTYPRTRLMKYLYYDTPDPLSQPLPGTQQKLALLFDPMHPTEPPDPERGYRIFPQAYIAQSQTAGATTLAVYMGQTLARSASRAELSVIIRMLTNVAYEANAGNVYSRTFGMECAVLDALCGINLNGVGTFYFDRTQHPACGAWELSDRGTNVGRQLTLGLTWCPDD